MRGWILCCGLAAALAAAPAAGITLGQVDDFQDGSLQGWAGGAMPTNIASGGPSGVGDRYLQISSSGGNLGTNNIAQWIGDYDAAGVVAINFLLNNLGPNPLALRVTVFGNGGTFTTTNETVLPAASGWVSVGFGLDDASLTQTAGNGTLADTLATVNTLLIRHDPDPISGSGQPNPVTGTLGIDEVTALPEPGSALLLPAGLVALWVASRTRRPRPHRS